MILGVDVLGKLVSKQKLVVDLSDRELTNPEGCGYNLRLGKVHRFKGTGYLGIEERKTPDTVLIAEYSPKKKQIFKLLPGQSVSVTTVESVNLPHNLIALLQPRSTLYRSGIIMRGGNVAPGYKGNLSFILFNPSKSAMTFEMGARIVHILFFEVKGKSNAYRGQWQGGRVSTKKLEKQV